MASTACQTAEYPAPIVGTAYRIDKDVAAEGSEIRINLLTTEHECANAKIEQTADCVPFADRAKGEMRLAFDLRDPVTGGTVFRSLDAEMISVSQDSALQDDFQLVPHDPVSSGQLFVLVIDGSGSMYENDGARIKKVYDALMQPEVARGFLPEDNGGSGVVLLRFSKEVTGLDGGPPRVIRSVADYRGTIKDNLLKPHGGFTHLYDAVAYALTDLPNQKPIERFLAVKSAEPTVIVLTDGFNNEASADTCGTNVERLQSLLDTMKEVQRGSGVSARSTVYTVGFGNRYRPGELPDGFDQTVTTGGLCGRYADQRIDRHLEIYGIDHISLAWIAEAAGGVSFVKRDASGLADTFKHAARDRYRWYELRYRVRDSFHHRRSFDTKLRLLSLARAETTVRVHPSGWLDGPPAVRAPGASWASTVPFGLSLGLLLPILGVLISLMYAGPAFFNARRALFRRARPRVRQPAPPSQHGEDAV
jgi:hypothetical protein